MEFLFPMWMARRKIGRALRERMLVIAVHEAMQNAPHDGRDYRQARAAIAAVRRP